MKVRVLQPQRFGEGWAKDQIVDMDEIAARVPLEKGYVERVVGVTPAGPVGYKEMPGAPVPLPSYPTDPPTFRERIQGEDAPNTRGAIEEGQGPAQPPPTP